MHYGCTLKRNDNIFNSYIVCLTKSWASPNPIGTTIRGTPLYKRNATGAIWNPISSSFPTTCRLWSGLFVWHFERRDMQVYLTLCCALVASAVGVYLHLLWNIGGFLTLMGVFGSTAWLMFLPLYEEVAMSLLTE